MRSRERHVKRRSESYFHEENLLVEFTIEVKHKLLDDRDNHWLDKAIIEGREEEDDEEKYEDVQKKGIEKGI